MTQMTTPTRDSVKRKDHQRPARCAARTTPGLMSRRGPRGPSGVIATCSRRRARESRRAARARPPGWRTRYQVVADALRVVGEVLPFARFADDDRHLLMPVPPEQRQQRFVPEQEDERRARGRRVAAQRSALRSAETPRMRQRIDHRPARAAARPQARPELHAASNSPASCATRALAPGPPRRRRTSARPSRCSWAADDAGSSSGRTQPRRARRR